MAFFAGDNGFFCFRAPLPLAFDLGAAFFLVVLALVVVAFCLVLPLVAAALVVPLVALVALVALVTLVASVALVALGLEALVVALVVMEAFGCPAVAKPWTKPRLYLLV